MLYFAYGSNMSSPRLRSRLPLAVVVSTGVLRRHALRFHKVSCADGSAKCDISTTGNPVHEVHGVVFDIPASGKKVLDRYEGVGRGYESKTVTIELQDGKDIQALTYYATLIDPDLRPYNWYREHVLRGAREHALPAEYVRRIEEVTAIPDPDARRSRRELAIYEC